MLERDVDEETLIKEAYDYYEVRLHRKNVVQIILDYIYLGIVPPIVEDYCFAIILSPLS